MSELDRQRAEIDELRNDFEEHKSRSEEIHEEINSKLDRICEALDYLVSTKKLEEC